MGVSDGLGYICPLPATEVQYQRDDDNDDSDWSDSTLVNFNTPTATEFVHENVPGGDGVVWEYRVQAVNGKGQGTWTNPDSDAVNASDTTLGRAEVPARAPSAPELTATPIGPTEIRLEWTIPQSNGTTIVGFDIRQYGDTAYAEEDLLTGEDDGPGQRCSLLVISIPGRSTSSQSGQ